MTFVDFIGAAFPGLPRMIKLGGAEKGMDLLRDGEYEGLILSSIPILNMYFDLGSWDTSNFLDLEIRKSCFVGTILSEVIFRNVEFNDVKFYDVYANASNFLTCKFSRCQFFGCNFDDAVFDSCGFSKIIVEKDNIGVLNSFKNTQFHNSHNDNKPIKDLRSSA